MFCTFWFSSKPKRTNQPKLVSRFRFDFAFHLGSGQFLSPSDEWVFGNSVRSVRPDGAALALENTNVCDHVKKAQETPTLATAKN